MVAHSANRALHDQHAIPVLVAVHGVLEDLISGESRSAAQKMCKPKTNQEQTRSKPALSSQSCENLKCSRTQILAHTCTYLHIPILYMHIPAHTCTYLHIHWQAQE
jgi:hypothetical protein